MSLTEQVKNNQMDCPYCFSKQTFTYYKSAMPSVLSACPANMLAFAKIYPFEVALCKNCGLGFDTMPLPENDLKVIYDNYLYISPFNNIGRTKYNGIFETIKKYLSYSDKIVDIGCSEGYLLHKLKNEGYLDLTGIEPGPQADKAKEKVNNIIKSYFDKNVFKPKSIDGFYLMHVFEHFLDPFDMLDAMTESLSEKGKIIIEVPNFNGYCHQHIFYYNTYFFDRLCRDRKLKIINLAVEKDVLRFVVTHNLNNEYEKILIGADMRKIISDAYGIQEEADRRTASLRNILTRNKGKKIYWWGAGSLSVILLNQLYEDIKKHVELVIVDGDKNKSGFYIPIINLKVNSYEILRNKTVDCLIVASSFFEEISNSMKENNISARNIERVIAI